jgi:hypothetical protein
MKKNECRKSRASVPLTIGNLDKHQLFEHWGKHAWALPGPRDTKLSRGAVEVKSPSSNASYIIIIFGGPLETFMSSVNMRTVCRLPTKVWTLIAVINVIMYVISKLHTWIHQVLVRLNL